MIDFSIIFNGKRPFQEFGEKCILPIISSKAPVSYEIIFGHNTNIEKKYENVKFINYGNCSSVESLNMLSSISKGQCLIYLNDAVLIGDSEKDFFQFFEYLYLTFHHLHALPKFQISSVPIGDSGCNLPFGKNAPTVELSKFPTLQGHICRCPIVTRKTLEKEFSGKIFNPSFIHHWVDNWLGIYCSLLNNPIIEYRPNNFKLKVSQSPSRIRTRRTDSDSYDYDVMLKLIKSFSCCNSTPGCSCCLGNPDYTKLV